MERLFSPCTRLYDSYKDQGSRENYRNRHLREVNLDVSTEVLLSAERAFTYADLYAMLCKRNTIAWLTPHAVVLSGYEGAHLYLRSSHLQEVYSFQVNVNGKNIHALTHSSAAFSEIFDVVRRLLLADVSQVHELDVTYYHHNDETFFNAAALASLMEQCQSLTALKLEKVALDEDHFRALGAFWKPGLEIELNDCQITGDAEVLAEVLASNQGPTKLDCCYMDYSVFANGLRGNSRLKSLKRFITHNHAADFNQEVLAIAGALKENKGLVELNLNDEFGGMSDECWIAVCDSLKTHPTLEVLEFGLVYLPPRPPHPPAVLKSRIQALLHMLKVNMSIHTIHIARCYREHELFRGSVIPYLETNRLRPRVRAIQKTRPVSYRAKVLGRALVAARTDVNSFWMLLSGNAEVAFSSTTATTAPASSTTGAWCLNCW
jgi:hypothetical protein